MLLISLIAEGLKNHEIATTLGTTEGVIKNRVKEVFDKLGFSNRVELALWYVKQQHDQGVSVFVS